MYADTQILPPSPTRRLSDLSRGGNQATHFHGIRGSPFRSGHTDSQGRHVHAVKYEPRERSNSVMSTLSSRMRQFGPSRDYPYALPGEFSEEEENEENEENVEKEEEEETEETEDKDKEEKKKEEPKEEKEKESENDETASVSCCSCSEKIKKKPEKEEGKLKERDEKIKDHVEVKEVPKVQELNLKRNPMKTMIAAKIDRGNHISCRFY